MKNIMVFGLVVLIFQLSHSALAEIPDQFNGMNIKPGDKVDADFMVWLACEAKYAEQQAQREFAARQAALEEKKAMLLDYLKNKAAQGGDTSTTEQSQYNGLSYDYNFVPDVPSQVGSGAVQPFTLPPAVEKANFTRACELEIRGPGEEKSEKTMNALMLQMMTSSNSGSNSPPDFYKGITPSDTETNNAFDYTPSTASGGNKKNKRDDD